MRADAESSCTASCTDSWSPDGARNPWSARTTELWAPTPLRWPDQRCNGSGIGIDSHKDTLVGCLIDADERVVEHRDVPNSAHGHAELVAWAQTAGVERVGIEGSGNYGRPAAQALLAAGTTVVEVPPQMTAAARRGRRSGAKTDHIDALEIARIAARDDDLPAPRCANAPDDLQCLVGYRRELVKDRTAAINRLHASLEKIRCGYHTRTGALTSPKGLDAASKLLRGDTTTRAEVARDRITHIRRLNRHIDQLGARIATEVFQRGTSLTDIYGIGALTAAEIITETGDPGRYRTKARFAMANGTAPIEASSGRVVRHRLNRGGNRQLAARGRLHQRRRYPISVRVDADHMIHDVCQHDASPLSVSCAHRKGPDTTTL